MCYVQNHEIIWHKKSIENPFEKKLRREKPEKPKVTNFLCVILLPWWLPWQISSLKLKFPFRGQPCQCNATPHPTSLLIKQPYVKDWHPLNIKSLKKNIQKGMVQVLYSIFDLFISQEKSVESVLKIPRNRNPNGFFVKKYAKSQCFNFDLFISQEKSVNWTWKNSVKAEIVIFQLWHFYFTRKIPETFFVSFFMLFIVKIRGSWSQTNDHLDWNTISHFGESVTFLSNEIR